MKKSRVDRVRNVKIKEEYVKALRGGVKRRSGDK